MLRQFGCNILGRNRVTRELAVLAAVYILWVVHKIVFDKRFKVLVAERHEDIFRMNIYPHALVSSYPTPAEGIDR